jgi:hypothetical protein
VTERQKGSHVTWVHERQPDIAVVLAVQDGEDAEHYEERDGRQAISLVRVRDAQEEP